jgi:hypothetical protein
VTLSPQEAAVTTREPRDDNSPSLVDSVLDSSHGPSLDTFRTRVAPDLERDVEYVVDECFFTVGQVVGMRMTVEYDAVIWWRDHYRARFLAAMKAHGNRWLLDRANVTSVAIMLAERAVRYSEGRASIDCDAARKAAADVERYCQLHAQRKSRTLDREGNEVPAQIAGYWCIDQIP